MSSSLRGDERFEKCPFLRQKSLRTKSLGHETVQRKNRLSSLKTSVYLTRFNELK